MGPRELELQTVVNGPCEYWEPNLSPLQKQQALVTVASSLQAQEPNHTAILLKNQYGLCCFPKIQKAEFLIANLQGNVHPNGEV